MANSLLASTLVCLKRKLKTAYYPNWEPTLIQLPLLLCFAGKEVISLLGEITLAARSIVHYPLRKEVVVWTRMLLPCEDGTACRFRRSHFASTVLSAGLLEVRRLLKISSLAWAGSTTTEQ